jgi:CRISPR/Cas system-associated endonuclease/helicase Cas3
LYLVIASSDYIYGTNYQFCHGYLSKDLNLTQEKIIQAMGRIGRNNIQQTYTLRFRDDQQILKLFTSETEKPEIINMNRLFNSRKVIWDNSQYIEIEDDIEDESDVDEEEEAEYIADYDVEEY